jgi:hypothetical protein
MTGRDSCSLSLEDWSCVRQGVSPYLVCCMDTRTEEVRGRILKWSVPCVVCHGEPMPATFHEAMHVCAQKWTDCLFVWCPFAPRFGTFGCNGAGVIIDGGEGWQSQDPLQAAVLRIEQLAFRCMMCNVITSVADLSSIPESAPLLVVDARATNMADRLTQWRRDQQRALKFVIDLSTSEWFAVEHGVVAGDEILLTRAR